MQKSFCGMDEEWAFGSFTTPDDPSLISFFFQLLILSYGAYRGCKCRQKMAEFLIDPQSFGKFDLWSKKPLGCIVSYE